MRIRVNRLGGLSTPDGDILDGLCQVDETDSWICKALYNRDIVRVTKDGSYLIPAPSGYGPVSMEETFSPFPEDFDDNDLDFYDILQPRRPNGWHARTLDEVTVTEMLCLKAAGCSVKNIIKTYEAARSTVYCVLKRKTWSWVDMPNDAVAKGAELMRMMGL